MCIRVSGLRTDFRLFEQGIGPALFFLLRLERGHAQERSQVVERDEAPDVDEGADGENRPRTPPWSRRASSRCGTLRRARIGTGRSPLLALGADAPGQHGEQHDPPDQEIDRDAGRDAMRVRPARARPACRRNPWDAGTAPACRGRRSWARRRPARARPSALSRSRAARMSSTS